MCFTRFLHNRRVSVAAMARHAGEVTRERVLGRDILAIQDTSDLVFGGKKARSRGFGPVGKGGATGGLCLHPILAVDAGNGALLGLAGMKVWNRSGGRKVTDRRKRKTADKESQRWIDGAACAAEMLAKARSITVIGDRESDIYEDFARRPANVELLVRAGQNRRVMTGDGHCETSLFAFGDGLPEQGRIAVTIPAAPGRPERETELCLRFAPVMICKPLHGAAAGLPAKVAMTLVDIRETAPPAAGKPIHWRLLTTHTIESIAAARKMVDYYRRRWLIEEFFRTLKTAGFNIEEAEIETPEVMENFVAAATVAAVSVMQLVQARDGKTNQPLKDTFDPADQPLLEAVSKKLEGKTTKQQNPYSRGSLAFAAWVIARLGGWDGYYGKPGPLVMRRGLEDFSQIKYGATLGLKDV